MWTFYIHVKIKSKKKKKAQTFLLCHTYSVVNDLCSSCKHHVLIHQMSKKAFSCFNHRGKCFPEAIRFPIGHFGITCLSALTAREAGNGYQAFSVFTVGSGLSGQGKEMEAHGIGNQQYLLPRTVTGGLSTSFYQSCFCPPPV